LAKAKETSVSRRIFPGRVVEFEEGAVEFKVRVYPPGFQHFELFSTRIAAAVGLIANMDLRGATTGSGAQDFAKRVIQQVGPIVLSDLLGLVRECCVVEIDGHPEATLDDLPHWHLASVVEAWIEESFLEERKWRPWLGALERLISKATGQPFSISETLSSRSSSPATPTLTSSDASDPDGPIEAGVSPSSGSGSESPSA